MPALTEVDVDLLKRYQTAGPRYTSYPTAPNFAAGFNAESYTQALGRVASDAELSLYVHVPFCESVCYFCACNVVYTKKHKRAAPYLERVEKEMDLVHAALGDDQDRKVIQLHWGGGTPTFLKAAEIERLVRAARDRFPFAEDAEVSIEIDPRYASPAQLDAIAAGGFNRASLGVQDVHAEVQSAIHRVQPVDTTLEVIAGLRERGIEALNVDLIYGLPHQSAASYRETIQAVIEMRPGRIALFNFAYLPHLKPHQKAMDRSALPSADQKLQIFAESTAALTKAGYRYIGLDHFARPEDELCVAQDQGTLHRNFQGYTTRKGAELIGLGVTSIGEVGGAYAQNQKDLEAYNQTIDAGKLATMRGLDTSAEDRLRRDVIMELICNFHLDKRRVEKEHGICFDEHFAEARARLAPFADDDLVTDTDAAIDIAPRGRFVVRNICMPFDAYLPQNLRSGQRFSQTV